MQDYYEILQVHPKADQESIQAAYTRMRERFDPAQLEGAADELVEIARRKRDDIERAYAVLGDSHRRATYDAERDALAASIDLVAERSLDDVSASEPGYPAADDQLDFRPLPPAYGQERPAGFNAQPRLQRPATPSRGRRSPKRPVPTWRYPVIVVGATTFVIVLTSLLLSVWRGPTPTSSQADAQSDPSSAQQQPPSEAQIASQFEGQIVEARRVTEQTPDNPAAWRNLGDVLYDSVQIVREQMPESDLYQERLPRWLEASEAYAEALRLQPDNTTVRADRAASLCKYGESTGEQTYVQQGLAEADQSMQSNPQEARVLLTYGVCLVSSDPPRTDEAMQRWLAVLDLPEVDAAAQAEARMLIEQYGQ